MNLKLKILIFSGIFQILQSFPILEVMTASTSGSNTEKGTDIKSAYIKMLNGDDYECPGINKRQVWGRMATQLFAKSVLAESWGSKTYWVVQDKLLQNIALTTKLTLNKFDGEEKSTVNFLSLGFNKSGGVELLNKFNIPSGIKSDGESSCVDILIPKENPSKQELLKCILRAKLSAIVTLR
ncbi:hypothetical protein [Arsukibacterium sp.]|uniref:hypothetical protein n=1 Tax=Arsukibacterium sp. TaxID=1977258 RepID=UPI001BD6894E|nr:hypothetical protein [Arsukibacterium sp.]